MRNSRFNVLIFAATLLISCTSVNTYLFAEGATVLERVRKVEDPELAELIRIAIANTPEAKEAADFLRTYRDSEKYLKLKRKAEEANAKVVRLVTEAYAQVKLLDIQIRQIDEKISSSQKTEAIQTELILAKAGFEARRTTKLAELRGIMNIVPKHAFGRKPVKTLKSWLALDVIGNSVYVLKFSRPYNEWERYPIGSRPVNLMSQEATITYIKNLIKARDKLPLRVDIFRNESEKQTSQELYKQVVRIVENANQEMEVEVYLDEIRQDIYDRKWILTKGQIYNNLEEIGHNDPYDEQYFFEKKLLYHLTKPMYLPLKISVEFDKESKDLAFRVSKAYKEITKELGIESLVEVELKESAFDIAK